MTFIQAPHSLDSVTIIPCGGELRKDLAVSFVPKNMSFGPAEMMVPISCYHANRKMPLGEGRRPMAGSAMARRRMRSSVLVILALCFSVHPLGCADAVEAGYTVFHGDRERPRVAITVDDCYNASHVAEVLDLCEEFHIPVTFFIIGNAVKAKDADVWQRAIDLGCEIGNHTWSHTQLPNLSRSQIISQLQLTEARLDEVLGWHYEMQVMRPPLGKLSTNPKHKSDLWVVEAIETAGYKHAVRWDVSQTDPDQAIRDVKYGSILLYHANPKDIRCLEQLIPALLEAGYIPVTVSDLLEPDSDNAEIEPSAWIVVDDEA